MKNIVWGINVIGKQGINAENDVVFGSNEFRNKVVVKVGDSEFLEDNFKYGTTMASIEDFGLVKATEKIDDSEATTINGFIADFNNLLSSLTNAGILSQPQPTPGTKIKNIDLQPISELENVALMTNPLRDSNNNNIIFNNEHCLVVTVETLEEN